MATDDLHAPLGLKRPAAGRPLLYSVAAAALGIATAAVVFGAAAWYEPLTHGQPAPPKGATSADTPLMVKPEPPSSASASAIPRVVPVPGTAAPLPRPLPQITGAISPAGALDGAKDQPAAPRAERIITIIDGRSGARQEVRIPATSDATSAPPPDPGLADLMRNVPDADEAAGARASAPVPAVAPQAKCPAEARHQAGTERVDELRFTGAAAMTGFENLPYRPCVGLAVINSAGRVFIGQRSSGPEHIDETHAWQMPQGGIDAGEDPWPAALRELYEETSIRSVERLGEIADWLTYDIPRDIVGRAWGGKYRGQTQKWYALRFTGDDREVDILTPAAAMIPSSSPGAGSTSTACPSSWCRSSEPTYERVVREFRHFTKV